MVAALDSHLPDDVKEYLTQKLNPEIKLYEQAKQHFYFNAKQCGV